MVEMNGVFFRESAAYGPQIRLHMLHLPPHNQTGRRSQGSDLMPWAFAFLYAEGQSFNFANILSVRRSARIEVLEHAHSMFLGES